MTLGTGKKLVNPIKNQLENPSLGKEPGVIENTYGNRT